MNKLAEQIIEWIKNGNWEVICIFILLISLPPIYKRLINADFSKLTKFSKLKELRDLNTKDATFMEYMDAEIETLAFYKATGIRTNKQRRKYILETFKKLNSDNIEFSMKHFKIAYAWLTFENEKLDVRMGIFFKLFFSMFLLFGLFFLAIPLILNIIWFFNIDEFKEIKWKIINIDIICFGYGAIMLAISSPLISMKILQKKLKKLSQNKTANMIKNPNFSDQNNKLKL